MNTRKKNLRTGEPLWLSKRVPRVALHTAQAAMKADIAIIGAGITGAMAAEELSRAGFDVLVVDRRGPMKGATSATTALLQYEIDQPMVKLVKQIGQENAMRAWRRSKLSLESLCVRIEALGIDCELTRSPSLYLAGNVLDANELQQEAQLRNRIGLVTDYLSLGPLHEEYGLNRGAALRSYGTLTVNPVQMAAGFLHAAQKNGARIVAPLTTASVQEEGKQVRITTEEGPVITADLAIYATGYEMPKAARSRRLSLHSTYVIATKLQKAALWPSACPIWEASDPYLYIRATADGRIICGGADEEFEDEKKRDAKLAQKTTELEQKLAALLPDIDAKAQFAWCGSFGTSNTGLSVIGKLPGHKNTYAILAFGGNGITFSRIAAELLTTTLAGERDPEADLFAF